MYPNERPLKFLEHGRDNIPKIIAHPTQAITAEILEFTRFIDGYNR